MSVPYFDPRTLWAKSPDDFNAWREANDLPIFLTFVLKRLPGFQQWMAEHKIDAPLFCKLVPSGDWFYGEERKLIVRTENDMRTHKYLIAYAPQSDDTFEAMKSRIDPEKIVTEIEPYFNWARRTLGRDRFFPINGIDGVKTESLLFNSWDAYDSPHHSRATLLSEFIVLKLGGVVLEEMANIGRRNLDFADLDHLTITGKYHSNYRVPINFSSCKKIQFLQARVAFFAFLHCYLEDLNCENSQFYDMSFIDCEAFKAKFSGCLLHKMTFSSTLIRPMLSNCELRDIQFQPASMHDPSGIADVYRLLRSAYQQGGQIQEAAEHYYLERTYRRKALWEPYYGYEYIEYFPKISKGMRSNAFNKGVERGIYMESQRREQARLYWKYLWTVWTTPRSAWHALRFKMKWLCSWIDNAIWGYGERPLRIFGTAAVLIASYTGLYYVWGETLSVATDGKVPLLECLYFSLVTFSTLGYGDITPVQMPMKLLCGSEAILGGFTMGLVVAGFSNKSRY
ncbi:ion channel [Collimonas humicola]|uniref:ion channel n=1 Tax=Collimonas humicola TaxID=2825886 RepID=UPI001B8AD30A|nr:ion channel [Collimonas humicola]